MVIRKTKKKILNLIQNKSYKHFLKGGVYRIPRPKQRKTIMRFIKKNPITLFRTGMTDTRIANSLEKAFSNNIAGKKLTKKKKKEFYRNTLTKIIEKQNTTNPSAPIQMIAPRIRQTTLNPTVSSQKNIYTSNPSKLPASISTIIQNLEKLENPEAPKLPVVTRSTKPTIFAEIVKQVRSKTSEHYP
jgi:hypothetical protein